MYSRNYGKGGRYNPPPGYVGNTFSEPEVKRHEPEIDRHEPEVRRRESEMRRHESESRRHEPEMRRNESEQEHEEQPRRDASLPEPTQRNTPGEHRDRSEERLALEELIHSLRGKIGSEELIILLVMLLTASDGICIETIILAAVLLAGGRESER